ncbi:hypothetical protein H6F74_18315 [Trichocoleus sp. FACHB-90]|uniref:hypothetical protein n=1 Tax=Cyanophyceae TaxID=3028117 RepID=UPI001687537C|nr:hypothetical protein [Trichocoleus sp. FACHB-90]MBD1928185.1 hypothetical protein [Trichocoleus sp. FACHB-90]
MIREGEIPDFSLEVGYLKGWLITQIALLYIRFCLSEIILVSSQRPEGIREKVRNMENAIANV